MIAIVLLLVIFIGLYFAMSLHGHLNKQLRDLDDHKQRCFDLIGRPRGAAARDRDTSCSPIAPQNTAAAGRPLGVLKRFSIR